MTDWEKISETVQAITRPLVTVMIVATLCTGFLRGRLDGGAFLTIGGIIVGFWFKDRQTEKETVATKAADKLVEKLQVNNVPLRDPNLRTRETDPV